MYGTIITESPKIEKEKSSGSTSSNTKGTATVKTGGEEIKNLQQDKISRDINDNISPLLIFTKIDCEGIDELLDII